MAAGGIVIVVAMCATKLVGEERDLQSPVAPEYVAKGSVKVMRVEMRHFDVPIVIGTLFIWTLVALIGLAPR